MHPVKRQQVSNRRFHVVLRDVDDELLKGFRSVSRDADWFAIPADTKNMYGYLSEHHAYGQTEKYAEEYGEDLAAAMLASTLGLEFDENKSWDEKKEVYRISDKIVRTTGVAQSAIVKKGWATVVAAGVFSF